MVVSCFYCGKLNRVKIGASYHNADAFYNCWSCGGVVHLKVRQAKAWEVGYEVQRGEEVGDFHSSQEVA